MAVDPNPESWDCPKNILVILAHPDDPEFFCGAMIARWCSLGHKVSYCLLTRGQRGSQDPKMDSTTMGGIRTIEQINAAARLGVSDINFLDYIDGELVPDIHLRENIIKEIRYAKPDVVVTCEPTNLFPAENRINHPDHRAAGQAVLDAVFPAAGNPGYQFDDDLDANDPHKVAEIWMALTRQPNFIISLTDFLDQKIDALLCHHSQLTASSVELRKRYEGQFEHDPATGKPEYKERFLRVKLDAK